MAPLNSSETEIAVIEGLYATNLTQTFSHTAHFNLHFTDRRIVGVHVKKASMTSASSGFGVIGGAIEFGIRKLRERPEESGATLDQLIASDKLNFSLPYFLVTEARLEKVLGSKTFKLVGKNIYLTFAGLNKQYEELAVLLPNLEGLKGRAHIP
jgi:hypothetical protein